MARVFITGSADGLGLLTARELIALGHQVVLHARNEKRAEQALEKVPQAETALVADLSDMDQTIELASKVNGLGTLDVVIHNAGIYQSSGQNAGKSNLPDLLVVNTLAPYILTCLIKRPRRLIYLASDMHLQGNSGLENLTIAGLKTGSISYSDTKLHNVILSMAVARKWEGIYANAVDPGWVPTKMGGIGAPGNLEQGIQTQVWLATNEDSRAKVSGCYFYHKKQSDFQLAAKNNDVQDKFLALCEEITGVAFY
ncbi:SDR family NAD(P)-dependent oxidoreductase [Dyadobacter sp. CY312]|uniref:SDR family NAD(P)-dependent oxidoreductase n=1 Tax=Dyadobacter sp. CY312 TaxID=2907303 RepID=UPI001F481E16|nr:SDR family NAD(P)-dependent oxidoreductase [Dyadobacter sp. CY312]MCE7039050.1 SDR family NAD(P)-dependent oxidoreductase [Dyadobacter sp. CY312]